MMQPAVELRPRLGRVSPKQILDAQQVRERDAAESAAEAPEEVATAATEVS